MSQEPRQLRSLVTGLKHAAHEMTWHICGWRWKWLSISVWSALHIQDSCITPFQHEMRAALAGGRQAQPGVATGQSVLAWRLGYAEVLVSRFHLRSNSELNSVKLIQTKQTFGHVIMKLPKFPASLAQRSACASSCTPSFIPSVSAKVLHSLTRYSQNWSAASIPPSFSLCRRPCCSFDPHFHRFWRRHLRSIRS